MIFKNLPTSLTWLCSFVTSIHIHPCTNIYATYTHTSVQIHSPPDACTNEYNTYTHTSVQIHSPPDACTYVYAILICICIYIDVLAPTYICIIGGACGVMVIVVGMDTATRVQILDETDCISLSTNTFGKGMNPIILSPAMDK